MSRISPLSFRTSPASEPASAHCGLPIVVTNEANEPGDAKAKVTAAVHAYMERTGRIFPTWSEVLEVLRDLGDRKS